MSEPPRDSTAPRLVVVGSINMDLIVRAQELPQPGETVIGEDLITTPGGKGANQAVAAARLGARVAMVGRVGDDVFGRELIRSLAGEQVDTTGVRTTAGCASGVAAIHVDATGENAVTVVSGANARLCPRDVELAEPIIAAADALLVQLEVPLPTVAAAVEIARRHGVRTILDPAPAPMPGETLPDELWRVDVISPNQGEAELLTGEPVGDANEAKIVGAELIRRGAELVAIKMGAAGAVLVCRDGRVRRIDAFHIDAADTTASGDAFTAGLAVGLVKGMSAEQAARMGCACGALAATRLGAQTALPTSDEVNRLLARSG